MEPGHEPAYGPCGEAGQYEQREDLGQYAAECSEEGYTGLRIEQRYCERHHNGYCQIDYDGVHYDLCHITSQLACNDCARCCGGADHAEHGGFKQYPVAQDPRRCG